MNGVKLIIFDLDGTLVDAYKAITKSVNFTLGKFGYPRRSNLKIRRSVGWGDRSLLAYFIGQEDLDAALKAYRLHHAQALKKYSRLLPYVKSVLDYLKKRGYKLAVASNRPTKFAGIIIRRLKIKKYFDYILCADKLKRGKPDPEILLRIIRKLGVNKNEAVYLGDMVVDMEASRRANIRSIAVRGGSCTFKEIKEARPFKIIKDLAALKKIF